MILDFHIYGMYTSMLDLSDFDEGYIVMEGTEGCSESTVSHMGHYFHASNMLLL